MQEKINVITQITLVNNKTRKELVLLNGKKSLLKQGIPATEYDWLILIEEKK